VENSGAAMHQSLGGLSKEGFAGASRLMAIFSLIAAAVIVIYAIIMVVLGTLGLNGQPLHWKAGSAYANVQFQPTSQKQLDMNCPQIEIKSGDLSKCAWTNHVSTQQEVEEKARMSNTFGNWLNAFIRPALWSVPVFLLAVGLIEASRCLRGLAAGRYFEATTVRRLRNFAIAGLLYVVLTPCMPVVANLLSHVLIDIEIQILRVWPPHGSWSMNMPSSFTADADVGGLKDFSGLLIALYAFTLAMIAVVMARASRIITDHSEIV